MWYTLAFIFMAFLVLRVVLLRVYQVRKFLEPWRVRAGKEK